jgi:hypothetical protein
VVSCGISVREATEELVKFIQQVYDNCGGNAEILEVEENILYKFKNGEYIEKVEEWSWLDKDDTNE